MRWAHPAHRHTLSLEMATSVSAARSQSVGNSNTRRRRSSPRPWALVTLTQSPSLGRWLPQEPKPQSLAHLHGVNVNREYAELFQVYRAVT